MFDLYDQKFRQRVEVIKREDYDERKGIEERAYQAKQELVDLPRQEREKVFKDNLNQEFQISVDELEQGFLPKFESLNLALQLHAGSCCMPDRKSEFSPLPIIFGRSDPEPTEVQFEAHAEYIRADVIKNAAHRGKEIRETHEYFYPRPKPDNKATIRIWRGDITAGSPGHVSLQTYGQYKIYASFWPGENFESLPLRETIGPNKARVIERPLDIIKKILPSGVNGVLLPNIEHDIKAEDGKQPDIEIDLYSLNILGIYHAFQEFVQRKTNWSLLASFTLSKSANCSELVENLLNVGGIYDLLEDKRSSFIAKHTPEEIGSSAIRRGAEGFHAACQSCTPHAGIRAQNCTKL